MTDEPPIPPRQEGREWVRLIQAQYGGPAFVRRAKRLADALAQLEAKLAQLRQPDSTDDWLAMVRIRLGQLKALAGKWSALLPWLEPDSIPLLQELEQCLSPRLRLPPRPDPRPSVLLPALYELITSIRRFNQRWLHHLQNLDLTHIQRLIDEYNCYYVLEKECFLQSPRLARLHFQPLVPLTWRDLLNKFPLLPEPKLRSQATIS